MKFLIVQLPPFSHHLIPPRSKYSSQNPVLKHPQMSEKIQKRVPYLALLPIPQKLSAESVEIKKLSSV
jgi:hypothetical protein